MIIHSPKNLEIPTKMKSMKILIQQKCDETEGKKGNVESLLHGRILMQLGSKYGRMLGLLTSLQCRSPEVRIHSVSTCFQLPILAWKKSLGLRAAHPTWWESIQGDNKSGQRSA